MDTQRQEDFVRVIEAKPLIQIVAAGLEAGGHHEKVVGYWREHGSLSHVVIRNAGHMVR